MSIVTIDLKSMSYREMTKAVIVFPLLCARQIDCSHEGCRIDRIDRPRREKTKEISYGDEQLLRDRRK